MNYTKQITIEANSKIRTNGTNNSFSVNFPNIKIPKGATINVSGSIIEELGASNANIIELQKTAISEKLQYNSCNQGLEIIFYLCNNGYNTVAAPIIKQNGYKIDDTNNYNKDLDGIKHNATLGINESFNPLKLNPANFINEDYVNFNDRSAILLTNNWHMASKDNRPPQSNVNFLGTVIDSPASIYCGSKKFQPDGVKYILVQSNYTGLNSCFRFKNNVEIDLSENLMETPQEISYRINTILQTSTPNQRNLAIVKGLPHSYGDNTLNTDYQPIFNFSGETCVNIPANGQMPPELVAEGEYTHAFYSNMAVRDIDRWEGGSNFLLTTSDHNGGSEGIDFSNWGAFADDSVPIFRNIATCYPKMRLYPLIMGVSFNMNKAFLIFRNFINLNLLTYQTSDGSTDLQINENNITGSDLPDSIAYLVIIDDLFLMAKIEEHPTDVGEYILNCYSCVDGIDPALDQQLKQPLEFVATINYSVNETLHDLTFTNVINGNVTIFENQGLNDPFKDDDNMYNGLPYKPCHNSDSGGKLANHMENTTDNEYNNYVNDFLAIPDKFIIPFNILYELPKIFYIRDFLRANEIYIGNETTLRDQNNDVLNWVCKLDIGFNDSYLSTKVLFPKVTTSAEFTKGQADENANFSFYGEWYPNMISAFNNRNRSTDDAGTFERLFPLQVFPINSSSDMGSNIHSKQHNIYVYSRFDESLYSNLKKSNDSMNLVQNEVDESSIDLGFTDRMGSFGYILDNTAGAKETFKNYNVPLCKIKYPQNDGTFIEGIAFINAFDSMSGNGQGSVDYSLTTPRSANHRTSFRICCGCFAGFDPSPLINNFILPVNTQQSNNENTDVRRWEVSDYEPDDANHAKYSSYIEDYINFIFVGTVNPQINFNSDQRFEIVNFHTPRLFNQEESKSTGVSVGSQVAIFNEEDATHRVLRVFGSDDTDPDSIKTKSKNFGIADSICGIAINDITTTFQGGQVTCSFDESYENTFFFEGGLLNRLGFTLDQFKYPYGSQDKRINLFYQNSIDSNNRYNYFKFFTTEGFLNQSINQLISIFGPNQPDNASAIGNDPPVNLRGLPQYYNGYVGLLPYALNVESFKIRAKKLPSRLLNSYYQIITTLPTTHYISRNNLLNVSAYVYKQYRTGNYFFSYASDQIATATHDFVLTNIKIEIRNNNGSLAANLGENNSIFFKISFPMSINMPVPQKSLSMTEEQLIRINSNIKDLESITQNKNNKMKIGEMANNLVSQIQEQNNIIQEAYKPPIPNPTTAGLNVISNTNPVFNVVNLSNSTSMNINSDDAPLVPIINSSNVSQLPAVPIQDDVYEAAVGSNYFGDLTRERAKMAGAESKEEFDLNILSSSLDGQVREVEEDLDTIEERLQEVERLEQKEDEKLIIDVQADIMSEAILQEALNELNEEALAFKPVQTVIQENKELGDAVEIDNNTINIDVRPPVEIQQPQPVRLDPQPLVTDIKETLQKGEMEIQQPGIFELKRETAEKLIKRYTKKLEKLEDVDIISNKDFKEGLAESKQKDRKPRYTSKGQREILKRAIFNIETILKDPTLVDRIPTLQDVELELLKEQRIQPFNMPAKEAELIIIKNTEFLRPPAEAEAVAIAGKPPEESQTRSEKPPERKEKPPEALKGAMTEQQLKTGDPGSE